MNELRVGDIVDVTFSRGRTLWNMCILYIPSIALGDCWKLSKKDYSELTYIQTFESMRFVDRPKEKR